MTGSQLKAWRVRMRLGCWTPPIGWACPADRRAVAVGGDPGGKAATNFRDFLDRLGVSRDTYGRLERQTRVPRYIQLACAALAYGLPPME